MSRLVLALASVGLLAIGCPSPAPVPSPPTAPAPAAIGAAQRDGLRSSVIGVRRSATAGSSLEVNYVLEWTSAPTIKVDPVSLRIVSASDLWLLGPSEPAVVRFWDAQDHLLGETRKTVFLAGPFRDRSVPRSATQLAVAAPSNAESVSVALGLSGLESSRVRVPAP